MRPGPSDTVARLPSSFRLSLAGVALRMSLERPAGAVRVRTPTGHPHVCIGVTGLSPAELCDVWWYLCAQASSDTLSYLYGQCHSVFVYALLAT